MVWRSLLLSYPAQTPAMMSLMDDDAPVVSVWRSEDDSHWTVQIDTTQRTGFVAVDLSDGRIFYGDPEVLDPVVAAQAVLEASGEHLRRDTIQAVVDAVRGDVPCTWSGRGPSPR